MIQLAPMTSKGRAKADHGLTLKMIFKSSMKRGKDKNLRKNLKMLSQPIIHLSNPS
jgi:hypothetical protein